MAKLSFKFSFCYLICRGRCIELSARRISFSTVCRLFYPNTTSNEKVVAVSLTPLSLSQQHTFRRQKRRYFKGIINSVKDLVHVTNGVSGGILGRLTIIPGPRWFLLMLQAPSLMYCYMHCAVVRLRVVVNRRKERNVMGTGYRFL